VASVRIYTAPGVSAYTVYASSLNTSITLSAGTYNTVVQSWDNCGNVGKTFVTINVGGSRPQSR
jgi:major membrane immunogen (membrane-anchored lipoprotein)